MTVPVLTFFNNSGVGKTSLAYHVAWMMSRLDQRVVVCDLDPQANLTAAFLQEEKLEEIWSDNGENNTIAQCVEPLSKVGDLKEPLLQKIKENLYLIPGDLNLSSFEENLASEWPNALGASNLYRPFRIITAFWQIAQAGARSVSADIIIIDLGSNLGELNRSAMIATDYIISPLGADMFSLLGLRNLGPTLETWREQWKKRASSWEKPDFNLPGGSMRPIGYIVQQHGMRLGRPVNAYDKWVNRIPKIYQQFLLNEKNGPFPDAPENDRQCLATVKHYRSLIPMAQESRKPVFLLKAADGAIGGHAAAVSHVYDEFQSLTHAILSRIGLHGPIAGVC